MINNNTIYKFIYFILVLHLYYNTKKIQKFYDKNHIIQINIKKELKYN